MVCWRDVDDLRFGSERADGGTGWWGEGAMVAEMGYGDDGWW